MKPISIILPVYNGLHYLDASLTSVLDQSYVNFELLIIDDHSDDGSLQYLQSLEDKRIQLFKNEKNMGLFFNLNFLIGKSNSPLVKLWSQDDIMHRDCIKHIIAFHNNHPQIGFSYSGRDIIDEKGGIMPFNIIDATPEIVTVRLHTRIAFFTGSIAGNISNVTLSRKALETTGPFNESMKISGDFDMWVRIAKNYSIGFIKDHLVKLRNHTSQLSRQEKYYINHLREDLQVYEFLLGYINEYERKEGKTLLRNHKLLFYYTLMVKAFFKGSLNTAFIFF